MARESILPKIPISLFLVIVPIDDEETLANFSPGLPGSALVILSIRERVIKPLTKLNSLFQSNHTMT